MDITSFSLSLAGRGLAVPCKLSSLCMQGNEGCISGIRCSKAVMREACAVAGSVLWDD